MAGIAVVAIAYMLSQFFRSFMAVLTPALTVDIGMTKAELSLASGAWFAAFALLQFVVGVSLDRYGPKRTASVLMGLCGGLGAFIFSGATQPWMIIVGMGLIGAGCAPVLMAAVFIFARSYPPSRLAVLTSWLIALGSAGNVVGTTPLAAAAETFGWRLMIFVAGLIALAIASAMMIFLRDPPRAEGASKTSSGFSGYLEVARLRKLWPLIPLVGINYAPLIGILGLWAGPYLTDVYGADALSISYVTFFMALAAITGSFLYGPLDTIFGTRKWVVIIGNLGSVLAVTTLAIFPVQSIGFVTIMFCLVALFGSSFAQIMAHSRAFIPLHLTGRGITFLNFFSIGLVGVVQFATGAVVTAGTVPGRPEAAYATLFTFYAVLLGAAVLIYLFSEDAPPEKRRKRR